MMTRFCPLFLTGNMTAYTPFIFYDLFEDLTDEEREDDDREEWLDEDDLMEEDEDDLEDEWL